MCQNKQFPALIVYFSVVTKKQFTDFYLTKVLYECYASGFQDKQFLIHADIGRNVCVFFILPFFLSLAHIYLLRSTQ